MLESKHDSVERSRVRVMQGAPLEVTSVSRQYSEVTVAASDPLSTINSSPACMHTARMIEDIHRQQAIMSSTTTKLSLSQHLCQESEREEICAIILLGYTTGRPLSLSLSTIPWRFHVPWMGVSSYHSGVGYPCELVKSSMAVNHSPHDVRDRRAR